MSKREQITLLIEEYIEKFLIDDEIVLSVAKIRKWPAVDTLCESQDPANICQAMKNVKYGKWYISGKIDSTTYTMMFSRKIINTKTEGFTIEPEMQKAVSTCGAKYATYKNNEMKIHYPDCHHLWLHGGGNAGFYTIHLTYKSAKMYANLKDSGNWNCIDCEKRHGKMK